MIEKILRYKFFALVVLIALVLAFWTVSPWLLENKLLYFWDAYVPFDPGISFQQISYYWSERLFPGYPTTGWSWFLYWGLFFLPYLFINSLPISEAFVYMLLLVLSVINFYLLSRYIMEQVFEKKTNSSLLKLTALLIGVLYTFNLFTFFNFYFMFNPGAFVLALLPLNILALLRIYPFDQAIKRRKYKIWLVVFFFTLLGMSPGLGIYVLFLQYLIWVSIYMFFFWIQSKRKILSAVTLELMLFLLLIIFANLWWLIPSVLGFKEAYSGQSSFGTAIWFDIGFKPSQLLNALRLIGSGLMVNNKFSWSYLYESNALFTLPLFIFPCLFILSLFYIKEKMKPILVFFLMMTLFSLFIVKFSNPPLSWILSFAYHYIPFFGGFRDAFQKAGVYFIFGYFIFIAIGIAYLTDLLLAGRKKAVLFVFITVLLIGSIILSGPFFLFSRDNVRKISFTLNNKNYSFNAKTQIPPEYKSLKVFLERKCRGETIALIPRSGFVTDGVWEKYNMSYVGQDMLAGYINCNFLSTAMFNKYSESSIQSPYLYLQSGNFNNFKNYLTQNDIKYVLIRKDFVPQGFVTWVYVEPDEINKFLSKDSQFSKVYSNDFFILYEKTNQPSHKYGFSLTDNVVHLQSDLIIPSDFAVVTDIIGSSQAVVPNSIRDRFKFEKNTKTFASIASCIGCIQLEPDAKNKLKTNLTKQIKKIVKSAIRKEEAAPSLDVQISLEILEADDVFNDLIQSIEKEDQSKLDEKKKLYLEKWNHIKDLMSKYDSDKFSESSKYTEITNFLLLEKNTLYPYMVSHLLHENKFLNKQGNRQSITSLFSFQKNLLDNFTKKVFQTNFDNRVYKMRMDIPKSGDYVCKVFNFKNNLNIDSVSMENRILTPAEYKGETSVSLKKGSYLTDIKYQPIEIMQPKSINLNAEKTAGINLGKFKPGIYRMNFNMKNKSGGRFVIAVSKGKKENNLLKYVKSTEVLATDFIFADQFGKDADRSLNYTNTFVVDLKSPQEYYFYIFYMDSLGKSLDLSDFSIETAVMKDDVRFACSTKLNAETTSKDLIEVNKKSPVEYHLKLPVGYKEGFLVFNQTYDGDWTAYEKGSNKKLYHFINGYSNAWHMDNLGNNEIIVEYKKQKVGIKSAVISFIVFVVIFVIYIMLRKKWK